jgi:hypothetical protein
MPPSETTQRPPAPRPPAESSRDVGVRWDATPIRSSAPPVTIVGSARRYRGGGFRVNV